MSETITITYLGHQGDGVGESNGKPVFVPFSLTGETLEVSDGKAKRAIIKITKPSPTRIEPFCQWFGTCGGCQLQHMQQDAYLAWKTSLLIEAFSREGIDLSPEEIRHYPRASRRRAVLTAKKVNDGYELGFSERSSHNTLDIGNCPVLVDELNAALGDIKLLLNALSLQKGDVRINLLKCENGLDLCLTHGGKMTDKAIRDLITVPAARCFIRISINSEVAFESKRPILKVGTTSVCPPPDAFVQANSEAETDMAQLVGDHLSKCKRVADLFCGFGTFALRLAENSLVYAAESNEPALKALDRAWRETGGRLKTITQEKRDLFRRPMNAKDLKHFDGAVFDPPRAGAEAQARELAKSKLKKIAAVSCNPQTLARDVKILVNGGFKIISATPLDQFAFTPHLETVVLLERK
ncbi:MAG: class I SAM-dependent RNA methyltransferase [Salaquimonas sp.]